VSKPEYNAWIEAYVERSLGHVRGRCNSASAEMTKAFPELRYAVGFVLPDEQSKSELPTVSMSLEARCSVYDPDVGLTQHAWCVTPEGEIVDPTISQFRKRDLIYVEYNAEVHGPLPAGKCPNCGNIVFPEQNGICNEECHRQFAEYLRKEGARF
jgi:hypothetical protein